MAIHPTAIVDKRAEIDPDAEIGPHTLIEGEVRIGPRTRVIGQAYITGWTEIGADCTIYPFSTVGAPPQDLAYKGERSYCRLGDGVIVREQVSIHRGTGEDTETVVGDHCFLMATTHVAHNCRVGEHCILVNGSMMGGHAQLGPRVFLAGNGGVHQFCRIGELAIIGAHSVSTVDVPPFFMTANRNECVGVNIVGLRRAGFSPAERREIQNMYRLLYRSGQSFNKALDQAEGQVETDPGRRLIAFLRADSKRGIIGSGHERKE